MKEVSTRHIRHDWRTWVDAQAQKSVMTLCGVKTRPGLAGIPGITDQAERVEANGKIIWGWCMPCVIRFYRGNRSVDRTPYPDEIVNLETTDKIRNQYSVSFFAVKDQFDAYLNKAYAPGLMKGWEKTFR